jgi:hypothetical protein
MPSRAELRIRGEQVLRGIVIAALAVMLWQSLRGTSDSSGLTERARGIGRGALAKWSAAAKAPERIQVQLDSVPTPVERAWLGALTGAGSSVRWSGQLPPVMIEAQPVAAPTGGTRVFVAAPRGSSLVLSDEIGAIDTLHPENSGASATLGTASGRISVHAKSSLASTSQSDSLVLHKVLVIGAAGWESKFVIAALEEEGWKVDASIRLAPGVDVTQGWAPVIDTSRYSAVIALDSSASTYANRIGDFVRNGGGVVLEPEAASLDAFAPLRAGNESRTPSGGTPTQATAPVTLATLELDPITSLRDDGVPLETRGRAVSTAARRIGAGRALQIGYEDSWRWRMNGGEDGMRDHRRWWTNLVSSVAYAPRVPRASAAITAANSTKLTSRTVDDAAPFSDLVASVGPSTSTGLMSSLDQNGNSMVWLFVILATALIAEVASRRLRGAA